MLTDKQEIFDFVVTALAKQGKLSTNGGFCRYRASDGSKCAIGHLIPDRLYRSEMEGCAIAWRGYSAYLEIDEWRNNVSVDFLSDLQSVHDEAEINSETLEFKDIWELGGIAYKFVAFGVQRNLNTASVGRYFNGTRK